MGSRTWSRGLDIGTGTGNSLATINHRVDSSVGLDQFSFLLQTAHARPDIGASQLVTANATQLPFKPGSFDLVISNGLTYYLPPEEIPQFARQAFQVLQPGGSYFEAFPLKEASDILPKTEAEFLTSAKAVLACLMDRLLTHQPESDQKTWSLMDYTI